jgi:hypothetical protein
MAMKQFCKRQAGMVVALAVLACSLALAPGADGAVFRGTAKGERIALYTDGAGVPTRVRFSGYKAECGGRGSFRDRGFSFIPPLDEATTEGLYDKGPAIRVRDADDPRIAYRILASVRARHVSDSSWTGRFRVLVKVSVGGDVFDRCRADLRFALRQRA